MSDEVQAWCFMAGANSIFYGEKLLTTGNPDVVRDQQLFARLGLMAEGSHSGGERAGATGSASGSAVTCRRDDNGRAHTHATSLSVSEGACVEAQAV
jgi:hypothetical protein